MRDRLKKARGFLEEAKKEFLLYKEKKDEVLLAQSAEKGWGAVASALKAVNPKIRRHRDFGETAAKLARRYNNTEIAHGDIRGSRRACPERSEVSHGEKNGVFTD
jgi:hypothetical protein